MKNYIKLAISIAILFFCTLNSNAEPINPPKSNTRICGRIMCNKEALPFVNIWIKGTTIGTASDEQGHFRLKGLPAGTYTVIAQSVGYKPVEKIITVKTGEKAHLKFELFEDTIGLDQVVVTADRNARSRKEAPVIVNTLTPKLFTIAHATQLSEGLNFCPGLRMENNCQNCGFSQLRMNGMEGAYSQILINSRPIFSGLAGVYGLEMIPANMLDRIEVTRGGGSALFGSNAIAGTVNLITKDPVNNSYEVGISNSINGIGISGTGGTSNDYNINFNTSIVTESGKTGLSIFGFYRNKEGFDANNDNYTESAEIVNTTIGTRIFHRINMKSKLTADFYSIQEKRRGGNKLDYIEHEADIAESLKNNILTGSLNYDLFLGEENHFSAYASGQKVDRDSYYGAERALDAYGNTKDFTYNTGAQFKGVFGNSRLVAGAEITGGMLEDNKLGYRDNGIPVSNSTIADQTSTTIGSFAQFEQKINRFHLSAGLRFDHYNISDKKSNNKNVNGNVISPRINILYDIALNLQARVSFSQGYRAPQIFDEDLHIESSGAKKIIHRNSKSLEQETSYSYTASIDYTKESDNCKAQFLVEGFYTKLDNSFVNEIIAAEDGQNSFTYNGETFKAGTVLYARNNADKGAEVMGVNMEFNLALGKKTTLKSGFTIQKSEYLETQEYGDFKESKFIRTPDNYGFLSFDYDITKKFGFSATGNYTGSMIVPYGIEMDLIKNNNTENLIPNVYQKSFMKDSDPFFDFGAKLRYSMKLNDTKAEIYIGMKNIFNSYQDDFDRGANRDPSFVYGPMNPRMFYFGIKIGNML